MISAIRQKIVQHRFLLSLAAIWFVAILLRGVYLWEIHSSPMATTLIGDAEGYDQWGREIANGDWLGQHVFYQAPLYPYFLGLIYSLAGPDPFLVRCVQVLLGATSCVLLAYAGSRFFSLPIGIAAGIFIAVYAPALFADGLIQKSSLSLFLTCALLAALSAVIELQQRPFVWAWIGLIVGALCLTRENALVLIPVVAAWQLWFCRTHKWRLRFVWLACFAAGVSLVLLPVAWRNHSVGATFVLTTSQLGPNFYIGNNRNATGWYIPLRDSRGSWRYERKDAQRLAEEALGRPLSPPEVSRYWFDRTCDDIKPAPYRWLGLLAWKSFLLVNRVELGDTEDQYTYEEHSNVLKLLSRGANFGLLFPLGLFGIVATWSLRRQLLIVYAVALVYAASVVLFYVFARYRLPVVPPLVLFAAAGIVRLPDLVRQRAFVGLTLGGVVMAAAAVLANWDLLDIDSMKSVTQRMLAVKLNATGAKLETVEAHLARAVRLDPEEPENEIMWGVITKKHGKFKSAEAHFEAAIKIDPMHFGAHRCLGLLLKQQGELAQALVHLESAMRLKPVFVNHYNLASACLKDRQFERALTQFTAAEKLKPKHSSVKTGLGIALSRLKRHDEAILRFRQAVELRADDFLARMGLVKALIATNQSGAALLEMQAAREHVKPSSQNAKELEMLIEFHKSRHNSNNQNE